MRRLALAATLLILAFTRSQAVTLDEWITKLRNRIRSSEKRYQSQVIAVAAVRGAKAEDPKQLYWKGRGEVSAMEMAEFKAMLALAEEKKTAEASQAADEFLAKHPQSPLKKDVLQTKDLLAAAKP